MVRLIPLRGYFDVNAYFYTDDATGHGFLIDPGGNKTELIKSITERIFTLPDETVLCSGHSEQTTIGTEKRRYSL